MSFGSFREWVFVGLMALFVVFTCNVGCIQKTQQSPQDTRKTSDTPNNSRPKDARQIPGEPKN